MIKTSIAVVGASGYGRKYIDEIIENGSNFNASLVAVVDTSEHVLSCIKEEFKGNVKCYSDLREMFLSEKIDIVFISSPIHYHKEHALLAMENGAHVMIEKPAAGSLGDVDELVALRGKKGVKALVGYQLVYDDVIRKIKKIILSNELGRILSMKCLVLWPRDKGYFKKNGWKGKKYDSLNRAVFDSVANNATAHHLMNLLYFAGEELNEAADIRKIDAKLMKAYDIETFDTCIVKAKTKNDIDMLYIASHASKIKKGPVFELVFEGGIIKGDDSDWVIIKDGAKTKLGESNHQSMKKVWDMIKHTKDDDYKTICTLECAKAQSKMIELLKDFPVIETKGISEVRDGKEFLYIDGFDDLAIGIFSSGIGFV
jgi:predicted dehydrogenase